MKLTKPQREALVDLAANGGEAIRHGVYFYAGGDRIGERPMIERMGKRGLLKMERVGDSVFAVITDEALAALSKRS